MIKPGSQWVENKFPHTQYIIGNEKLVVKLDDGPDDPDPIGDIILYHLRRRIYRADVNDTHVLISEMELRKGWWEVDKWEE